MLCPRQLKQAFDLLDSSGKTSNMHPIGYGALLDGYEHLIPLSGCDANGKLEVTGLLNTSKMIILNCQNGKWNLKLEEIERDDTPGSVTDARVSLSERLEQLRNESMAIVSSKYSDEFDRHMRRAVKILKDERQLVEAGKKASKTADAVWNFRKSLQRT